MGNQNFDLIRGSVMQRTFVSRELGATLNIATVPLSEIYSEKPIENEYDKVLRQITSDVLGIPNKLVLDGNQYDKLIRVISKDEYFYPYNKYLSERSLNYESHSSENLARDSLRFLASSPVGYPRFSLQFVDWPIVSELLGNKEIPSINSAAIQTGISCYFSSRLCEIEINKLITEILHCDIPVAQSPKHNSDSLLEIIKQGKSYCLAPIQCSPIIGAHHLIQGEFVAAILTMAAAPTMSFVLFGTLAVGEWLVHYLETNRHQDKEQSKSDSDS